MAVVITDFPENIKVTDNSTHDEEREIELEGLTAVVFRRGGLLGQDAFRCPG